MNSANITGRLTAAPHMEPTNDTVKALFTVAVKRIGAKNRDATDFISCVA